MFALRWLFGRRFTEFFEGDNERLSMTRLLCFLSFFPSSYVVISTKSESALGWYLGAYVLGYVGGKASDMVAQWAPGKAGDSAHSKVVVTRKEESTDVRTK